MGHAESDPVMAPPAATVDRADPGAHVVQFYEGDAALLEGMVRHIGAALVAGDAALVLATEAHRQLLESRLRERGLDISSPAMQGRYVSLDAAAVLARIMHDGQPDAGEFTHMIGGLIERTLAAAQGEPPRMAVFGELVALLCAAGNHQAAIQLEELWNDQVRTHPIALLCAYPVDSFAHPIDGLPFTEICQAHQCVVPAESYAALADDADRLMAIATLQQKARALETEIAAREQAQEHLLRREAELANFVEEVPIALHWVGPDGVILWANRAELALLGYRRDEYIGRYIADFHADQQIAADILAHLARHETLVDRMASLRHRDGSLRHVLINSNVHVEDGEFQHTRCVTRDITNLVVADEVSARLAAIVDSSDDAIISKALDGTITSWNRAAERLYGYTASEIIGRPIMTIVPSERRGDHDEIMARLAQGERIAHLETERVHKDGTRIEVSVTISPVYDRTGHVVGASKIARDITNRRTLERQKQEFLEMVAHDLGSPLTVIRGYGQLLQRRQAYDERSVAAIVDKATLMGRLVADMLDLTQLEAGRLELRRDVVDLAELIRGSAAQAALVAADRSILIDPPKQPVLGEWDGDRLAQVLTNLLDNALKYAPEGEIAVRVSVLADEVRVAVIDQGPGLTPTEQRRVFDHYFRSARTAGANGAGLGLFISKAIIEAHGGRLWVDSTLGEGSVFTFSLPYQATPPSAHETDSPALAR